MSARTPLLLELVREAVDARADDQQKSPRVGAHWPKTAGGMLC